MFFRLRVHNNYAVLARVFRCVQRPAGLALVGDCVNRRGKNLSAAGFRGTVPNQIYALTFLQGKKSPPAAKRVSSHRVMSVLGLLLEGERKASAKKRTLLVTFGVVIRDESQYECGDRDKETFLLRGRLVHGQDCSWGRIILTGSSCSLTPRIFTHAAYLHALLSPAPLGRCPRLGTHGRFDLMTQGSRTLAQTCTPPLCFIWPLLM